MDETPNSPQDLVALAEDRQKRERERKESKEQTRLEEARQSLKAALSESSWSALGIDPDAATARDSGVFAEGVFSYAGEEWNCEAYSSDNRRDGVKLIVQLGNGFYLSEKLRSPHYPGEGDAYQGDNAAAVGSLLASLPTQKALAAEKRAEQEKERLDKALSKAAYAFNTTYSASYLRGNLARADDFRAEIHKGTAQRERFEEMISDARKAASEKEAEASEKEAEAAERKRRAAELLEKVKKVADDQLEAQDDYDERCRRYAEEQAGAYFFAWTAQEIRYCPALTAEAISALRSSAAYYGGESGDEYAGAYDAVRDALVQKITALLPESGVAGQEELRYQHFDQLGYNGTTTPVTIGAFIDCKQVDYDEHDASESMVYHRTVPVGRSVVNLPPRLPNLEAVATRVRERAPKQPTPFDGRLQEAGVSDGDLDLLPHDERIAAQRGAYRFLAGESSNFDPYYDDLPW